MTALSTDGALIALSGLNCTGNETKLADCPHLGYGNHDCQPDQAAGLYCGCKAFSLELLYIKYIIWPLFLWFICTFFTLIKIVLQNIFFAQEQKVAHNVLQSSIYVMEHHSALMDLMK